MPQLIVKEYHSMAAIKTKWNDIVAKEEEVSHTPFQTYLYNKLCYTFLRLRRKYREYIPLILLFEEGEKVGIWPLLINEKLKTIYNSSQNSPMDYWDIISNVTDREFHDKCFSVLKCKYPNYHFYMDNIYAGNSESGLLFSILPHDNLISAPCVKICIDEYEDYYKGLSKHQRQNIRTAYNKLTKDNIEICLRKYNARKKISLRDYWKCMMMHERRSVMKIYRSGGSVSRLAQLNRYKNMILGASNISFLLMPESVIHVLYVKNTPVAYMAGFIDANGRYFINRLSSYDAFSKYDMGILLVDQVMRIAKNERLTILDLTRGDEPYKLAMGGQIFYNYCYQV